MSERGMALTSVLLALLGWLALAYLVDNTSPNNYTISLFLLFLFIGLAATFLPPALYLNRRFSRTRGTLSKWNPVRQSIWAALFIILCAWLQRLHVLNWMVGGLLAGVFILIEA
ncbi:MAG: hypothetical protein N2V78_00525, partial [Methanophagales archaeon]|nr:hypothetical protein [Methanophagales archaeon]